MLPFFADSAKERNQQILKTSVRSYEQIVRSVTANEKVREENSLLDMRDMRERLENVRVKTSASRDKTDFTESNKSSNASRTRQAFQIEPGLYDYHYFIYHCKIEPK